MPDADRITPPLLHPSISAGIGVTITTTVTGLPVKAITSNTHAIRTTSRDGGKVQEVTLREGETLPNPNDFAKRLSSVLARGLTA